MVLADMQEYFNTKISDSKIKIELIYNNKYQKDFSILTKIFSKEELEKFLAMLISFIGDINDSSFLVEISITSIAYSFSMFEGSRSNLIKKSNPWIY